MRSKVMRRIGHSSLALVVSLFLLFQSQAPVRAQSLNLADCVTSQLGEDISQALARSPELQRLDHILAKLEADGTQSQGPGAKVVMAVLEFGKPSGLKTTAGGQLNVAAGGVSAVMNDILKYYPKMLARQKGGELTIVSVLMDGMSKEGLTHVRNLHVPVDGHIWDIGVYEARTPEGARIVFLDNPSFKRFTATPDPKIKDQSVYTMRGLENETPENQLERQKVWSAINQSVAQVFEHEKGDIYVPHDSHMAPASYYIHRLARATPISTKPLVHNEGYLGNFHVPDDQKDRVRRIWNVHSIDEMDHYFMQGNQLVMMAPAVRVAEKNEIFTALSVSRGTANAINGTGRGPKTPTQIDFFDRVGDLTNGLGEENRPHLSELLRAGGTEEQIRADGIQDPEVIERFRTRGFRFGAPGETPQETLQAMADAKRALQKNFGMTVDPDKPLFVSFARFVHQKGMEFVASNIEHILNKGGQIIVGGPVGDEVGAAEREMFLRIKEKLIQEGNPHARDFVFIDGPVKGRVKGLVLGGGDFFLIPSRYEPCGLTDCEAIYHGTISIAHATGGLTKSPSTILYHPPHPDDQGWALGEAINESFRRYADRKTFQQAQLQGMKEDYSVEKNFDLFLENNRIEVYGKMLRNLESQVQSHQITEAQARDFVQQRILSRNSADVPELVEALRMLHPARRNELMDWLIRTHPR